MIDFRQRKRWPPHQLAQLVDEMSRAEVVRAEYGTGPDAGGQLIKGEELLKAIVASNSPRQLLVAQVTVANTTQIELLSTALMLRERGEFDDAAAEICAEMLAVAATVPGGHHDDVAFEAAWARAKGTRAGSA
jgi:hypothetical protein